MLKFVPFALTGLTKQALGQSESANPVMTPLFFDVRVYGATGSGSSLDSPGINAQRLTPRPLLGAEQL